MISSFVPVRGVRAPRSVPACRVSVYINLDASIKSPAGEDELQREREQKKTIAASRTTKRSTLLPVRRDVISKLDLAKERVVVDCVRWNDRLRIMDMFVMLY